ncbi:unnamed protein product [Prorocentrum cordatum]|uniref:Uncharacterized protein n=1 Tax=Prorocentrum cordatum TaxID=2364126 RepID=A0ABN9T8S3_9DINO|nr:unnamed protein product [Polarella glacialis]
MRRSASGAYSSSSTGPLLDAGPQGERTSSMRGRAAGAAGRVGSAALAAARRRARAQQGQRPASVELPPCPIRFGRARRAAAAGCRGQLPRRTAAPRGCARSSERCPRSVAHSWGFSWEAPCVHPTSSMHDSARAGRHGGAYTKPAW